MTLAHFGFGKNGDVLDCAKLPRDLTQEWMDDKTSKGKFPSYARLLSSRGTTAGESRYSWSIDFAARRKQAREEMKPYLIEAQSKKAEVVALKEKMRALKGSKGSLQKVRELEFLISTKERAGRDALAQAAAIDAAIFDLKAVNPNAVVKVDTRTPAEVIQSIVEANASVAESIQAIQSHLS
jgi:type I restriction enzyme M protein